MTATMNDDDGFEYVPAKKKTQKSSTTKRIYIGNLPVVGDEPNNCLEDLVGEYLNRLGIPYASIDMGPMNKKKSSTHAMIGLKDPSSKSIETAIQTLRRNPTWQGGRRLIIEHEKNHHKTNSSSNNNHSNNTKKATLKSSWNQPTKQPKGRQSNPVAVVSSTQQQHSSDVTASSSSSVMMTTMEESSKIIGGIVSEEIEATQSGDDATTAALASAAAVSLIASMMVAEEDQDHSDGMNNEQGGYSQNTSEEPDFKTQLSKPMSALLAEFGEADPNWRNVKVTEDILDDDDDDDSFPVLKDENNGEQQHIDSSSDPSLNRLTKHGKAPIHIEFISFGYHHGAPPETRNGWSHSQPLAVYDCRSNLDPVPAYLEWQDGLSGNIKRILVSQSDGMIRDEARKLAEQIVPALKEAIEAGYGYASPLVITIHVGSHWGKHRSVVLAELAATEVRKHLRTNKDNQITQPVSVGTVHVHKDRRTRPGVRDDQGGSRQKNRFDLEGDW